MYDLTFKYIHAKLGEMDPAHDCRPLRISAYADDQLTAKLTW